MNSPSRDHAMTAGDAAVDTPPRESVRAFDATERGRTVWFSSEEDGGPDCGISVGLGNDSTLYVGEMPTRTLEEHGIDLAETGDGWWLVLYEGSETSIIARMVGETYEANRLFEKLAAVLLTNGAPLRQDETDASPREAKLSEGMDT